MTRPGWLRHAEDERFRGEKCRNGEPRGGEEVPVRRWTAKKSDKIGNQAHVSEIRRLETGFPRMTASVKDEGQPREGRTDDLSRSKEQGEHLCRELVRALQGNRHKPSRLERFLSGEHLGAIMQPRSSVKLLTLINWDQGHIDSVFVIAGSTVLCAW